LDDDRDDSRREAGEQADDEVASPAARDSTVSARMASIPGTTNRTPAISPPRVPLRSQPV